MAPADMLKAILAHLPHGLCMFDAECCLIVCNSAYAAMYKLPDRLTAPGTALREILDYRSKAGSAPADLETYFDVVPIAQASGRHAGTRIKLEDGRTVQITHQPMADGGYVAVHEDVTAHTGTEERLRYLASHDQLTGLYNRHAFDESFEESLRSTACEPFVAIHCLDLDRFKAVNDALGHHAGDALLRLVAERILGCTAAQDKVGRRGGDEFIILQHAVEERDRAVALGRKVIDALARPFDIDGHRVSIGTSIGIALYPVHGSTAESLLRSADRALYRAKLDGGHALRFAEHLRIDPGTTGSEVLAHIKRSFPPITTV